MRSSSNVIPNIVVFGLGHSGTSVLTRMLIACGWEENDQSMWSESPAVDSIQNNLLSKRDQTVQIAEHLRSLGQPWVMKHPQLVRTIPEWMPALGEYSPALLWIRRDPELVMQSRVKRGAKRRVRMGVWDDMKRAQDVFEKWPWMKMKLDYDQLRMAISYFDVTRSR